MDGERTNLILTRREGQRIEIGPDCTVTVVEIRRGQVRLSIRSPRQVRIMRAELAWPDLTDTGPPG